MIVFQQILFALNLLLAFVFGVGYFVAESPGAAPRTKARMGVWLTCLFVAFLVFLTLFAVLSAVLKRDARYLALLLFAAIPFVIGRLVSYRTLGLYSMLQLLAFLLNAAVLCVI